ncbi:secreted protein [Arcticibacter pallidicorallinus]|uniref:Secreted protein n=1 Tax=Arcticibacter pallidicorallinus TaxID=1259464 RepID=A0A2T0U4H4_9SPHI|nr:GDSL-type esterase/lipase family protein [Arcticibacter pallidicorallinus]PRY52835.1 secreted protein [Arcticibacter pallidicorallinus]
MSINRRNFLKASAVLGSASFIGLEASAENNSKAPTWPKETKVLFQGDSITDGGRSRNKDWNHVMGHGYAYIVASRLGYEKPDMNYHFFNRGISGNTVPDLITRWQTDTVDLSPDILSILVGVNDTSAEIEGKAGFSASSYATGFRKLLSETKNKLPQTRLIIGEPFILPVGKIKANWNKWNEKISERQELAKNLAREFDATFIPFQAHFNDAAKKAPSEYWIWDGVHPMPAGHELMARKWMEAAIL